MVPVAYAEKTMSSLLRLHEELVEEKERRIDLYRRLMDREQELAELRAYVRLLEGEVAAKKEPAEEREAIAAASQRETAPAATGDGPMVAWLPANLRRIGK